MLSFPIHPYLRFPLIHPSPQFLSSTTTTFMYDMFIMFGSCSSIDLFFFSVHHIFLLCVVW
ncbi:unnamed protein product [Prunus brigantina]